MSVTESAWPMMECTPQQQLRNGELVICSHYMSCQVFALYWKICFSSHFSGLIVSPRKFPLAEQNKYAACSCEFKRTQRSLYWVACLYGGDSMHLGMRTRWRRLAEILSKYANEKKKSFEGTLNTEKMVACFSQNADVLVCSLKKMVLVCINYVFIQVNITHLLSLPATMLNFVNLRTYLTLLLSQFSFSVTSKGLQ